MAKNKDDQDRLDAEIALALDAPVSLNALYGIAAERAFPRSAMMGLRPRAKHDAELVRSGAIQMERLRCQGLDDHQLRDRLREHLRELEKGNR